MNRRNFPIVVSACACGLVLAASVHGQVEKTPSQPASKTDSPIGLTVSFLGSESPAQTHGPEIASEIVMPSLFADPVVEEAEFPVVDPESIPLPLTGSSGLFLKQAIPRPLVGPHGGMAPRPRFLVF